MRAFVHCPVPFPSCETSGRVQGEQSLAQSPIWLTVSFLWFSGHWLIYYLSHKIIHSLVRVNPHHSSFVKKSHSCNTSHIGRGPIHSHYLDFWGTCTGLVPLDSFTAVVLLQFLTFCELSWHSWIHKFIQLISCWCEHFEMYFYVLLHQ